jgi:uncharacterized protein (TIGR02145 family)
MKKTLISLFTLIVLTTGSTYAQVGIGTQTPDASAELEVSSTSKGFLPPRMTTTQRDDISNPAEGLSIYNVTTKCLQWYIGNNTWHDACGDNAYLQYAEGTVFCASGPTEIVEVVNPVTNKSWMDRNLGASQAATSSTDANSYGDLYQWGRFSDGHQCRTSPTTGTLATTSTPNTGAAWDGHFITSSNSPFDWLQTQDNFLWNSGTASAPVKTATNPCPTGYRVPTDAELDAERGSWTQAPISSNNNAAGAFASPLKLAAAGTRESTLFFVGSSGYYWSSTASGTFARGLDFSSSSASMNVNYRVYGFSVRCIKD